MGEDQIAAALAARLEEPVVEEPVIKEQAPEAQEESLLSQGVRGIARTASRVGEQIAGAPGDIFSLINEYRKSA